MISKKIEKVGRISTAGLGIGMFVTATVLDYNAIQRRKISKTKGVVNFGFGVLGLIPNPYTVEASSIYFGVEAFYPGGWNGLGSDISNYGHDIYDKTVQGIG